MKEQSQWVFSTRPIDVWPYLLHSYVEEAEKSEVNDYAVLCHAGHGANSWAIHYYLVQDSLRMFLQLAWGGVYSDSDKDAALIRDCFSLADQIASVAKSVGRFQAGNHLTVVVSNFGGSYWLPPGKIHQENDKPCDDPLAVLKEVLDWVKIEGGSKMKQREVCIIPFTKMRERFRKVQKTSIATQLKMADEAVAADIAKDFDASVVAFEEYENCEEEFHPGGRKPLVRKKLIKRPEDFSAQLDYQNLGEVQGHPSLNFRYVERELVPARTTRLATSSLTLMLGWRGAPLACKPTQQRQSGPDQLDLHFRAQSSAKTWKAVLSEVGGAGAPASLRRSKAQRRASAPGWLRELRQGL